MRMRLNGLLFFHSGVCSVTISSVTQRIKVFADIWKKFYKSIGREKSIVIQQLRLFEDKIKIHLD